MNILSKLLQKKGIKSIEELSPEEKTTFENYEKILSKRELTIEDLTYFLRSQVSIIEAKWKDYDLSKEKKADLIPYHTVYSVLLEALSAPERERENLEKYLTGLLL